MLCRMQIPGSYLQGQGHTLTTILHTRIMIYNTIEYMQLCKTRFPTVKVTLNVLSLFLYGQKVLFNNLPCVFNTFQVSNFSS